VNCAENSAHSVMHREVRVTNWYPLLGFDLIVGERSMRMRGIRTACGTVFRGICDADAGRVFVNTLRDAPSRERRFVYWLTLSAHFPVDESAIDTIPEVCVSRPSDRDETVCLLMRVWSLDLQAVRTAALDPALPPTRFIVVGDHQPPLTVEQLRLFEPDVVPFVELSPRSNGAAVPDEEPGQRGRNAVFE
jgi:hypothetical protein